MQPHSGTMQEKRVLILPALRSNGDEATTTSTGEVLHLQHPKHGGSTLYTLVQGELRELHWFKQRLASWFIDNSVCEDGSLYLATPVDPLFLVLSLMESARMKKGDDPGKFRELEEVLFVQGYPAVARLRSLLHERLPSICEVKEIGSGRYYRMDDAKVLAWLLCKVDNTVGALRDSGNSTFSGLTTDDLRLYAVGLISEYLPSAWLNRVCAHLKVDLDASKKARIAEAIASVPAASVPLSEGKSKPVPGKVGATAVKKGPLPGERKITSFFQRPR